MLRVLMLSSLFPDVTRPNFGVFVERQAIGLAARPAVDLRVISPIGVPPWPVSRHPHYRALADVPQRERWKGLEVLRPRFTVWPATQGRFHVAALVRALVPVVDAVREDFAFDVIDASFFFPDGPAAVRLGARYGVPVSIKARGADIHFWGRQGATAGQVLSAGRQADGLLAVSAAMRTDMIALGMPGDRIRVHHTGVDLDRFAPVDRRGAKAGLGISGPLVISVGALIPRKGHDIVIDAISRVPGATLLIAGEGPARPALEALIARTGAQARLLGAVPHGELPAMIAAADVMALASASEGLANAWVEALACGCPLVITEVGGAREVVTRPEAGRIVARNADAIAAAVRDLVDDPPAPEAVAECAAPFSWEANAAALAAYYEGLLAKA